MNLAIVLGAQVLPFVVVVAALPTSIGLGRRRILRFGIRAVLAVALTAALVLVADLAHTDPRPFVVDPSRPAMFAHVADNGFPSDHTAYSTTAALVAATVRRRWGVLLTGLAILGGLCRVWANVHHLQDIVAAAVIAVVAVALSTAVVRLGAPAEEVSEPGTDARVGRWSRRPGRGR